MDIIESTKTKSKFKPAPDLSKEEIKKILLDKISSEKTSTVYDKEEYLLEEIKLKKNKCNLIGLFSGCGGLDLGFELAGLCMEIGNDKGMEAFRTKEMYEKERSKSIFHTVYTNDLFKEANETYSWNFSNHVIQHEKDIRKVSRFPKCNIMLGGFPCPGFSEAGPRLVDDERNFLYIHFIRALLQSQPEIFVAENVKGMLTLGQGEAFRQIKQDFEAAGYKVYHKLMNARDYGVPQIRERVILVGVRNDIDFVYSFPKPTHGELPGQLPYVTLREAIGDLEQKHGDYYEGSYSSIFMSRNRKKSWDQQSFTIQASGRQAPIHPGGLPMKKVHKNKWVFSEGEENNRRLSIKEIARIQTFPDWFEFSRGDTSRVARMGQIDKVYKQIGNAVPVLLAKAIAMPIAEWAQEYVKAPERDYQQLKLVL